MNTNRTKKFHCAFESSKFENQEATERKIGGLGIYLMRKLMDDVSYSFDAEKGNTLVMRKMLIGKKQER